LVRFFKRSLKDLSDETLMEKVSEGSELALETIYDRYSQPLLRYFHRMLWQDRNIAQDFLHDLFIKILEKHSLFKTDQRFSTWIYSIAHNMCKNEYRKQAFRKSNNGHLLTEELSPVSVADRLDHQSFQKILEEILASEEEDIRTMFTLRYELDMDILEISKILQCQEGTVKSRLFYLKKRLATQLNCFRVVLEK
jgi:RNA polymerase sigma-70 factor, ECF subfamily